MAASITSAAQNQRLFLAIGLDTHAATQLAAWHKLPRELCRITPTANLHLTLIFIGNAKLTAVQRALQPLAAGTPGKPFNLIADAPGSFLGHQGEQVFWLGFKPEPRLLALRARLSSQLRTLGLQADTRPYVPHLTLARCKPQSDQALTDAFLALPAPPLCLPVTGFGLYSSITSQTGSRYQLAQSYRLPEAS